MIRAPQSILVPTDFSPAAASALRYAARLAQRFLAKLQVLYVEPFVQPLDEMAMAFGQATFDNERTVTVAREQLLRHIEENVPPSVMYDAIVSVGATVQAIVTEARESNAEMIVMGTHGRSGVGRLIAGSVTEAVMRIAPIPVIAVPAWMDAEEMADVRAVVCPIEYVPSCYEALRTVATIAAADARFIIVRGVLTDDLAESADELEKIKKWIPPALATHCEYSILSSRHLADRVISLAAAAGADMIVASEVVSKSMTDLLQGTFAERVIQQSGCPVLTINAEVAAEIDREEAQESLTAHIW
jgi:nucleotide-binding universal stress UspA family protein